MNILPIAINNAPAPAKGAAGDTPLPRNDPASQTGNAAAGTSQTGSTGNDPATEPFASLLARQLGETAVPPPGTAQITPAGDSSTLNQTSDAASAAKKARDQTAPDTGDQAGSIAAIMMQMPLQQNVLPVSQSAVSSAGKLMAAASPLSAAPSADQSLPDAFRITAGNNGMGGDPATQQKPTNDAVASSIQLAAVSADTASGDITALPPTTGGSAIASRSGSKSVTTSLAANNTDPSSVPTSSDNQALPAATDAVRNQAASSDLLSQPMNSEAKTQVAAPEPIADAMQTMQTGNALAVNAQAVNPQGNNAQAVTSPIGSSAWANEFSQKITWMSNQQSHSAELHLNPPDLGPLNVVLKMTDNQLTAQFTSPHSAVREAVENAMPKLREVLADNQITLGNTTVSDQSPRDRSGEGYQNRNSGSTAQRDIPSINTSSGPLSPATAQNVPARRHNGILDTFA